MIQRCFVVTSCLFIGLVGFAAGPLTRTVLAQNPTEVRSATETAGRLPRVANDGTLYESYAVVDGWWTIVLSNVPPSSGHYAVTADIPSRAVQSHGLSGGDSP